MKEVIFEVLNQMFDGDVIGYLATFIVALILGLFKKQPKWVQRLFNKGKDVLPDNVESLLVKFWDKIEPFAELLYKKVLEKLAQEMLKEVNGEEANLSTGLRSTMRDVKIELENKVKSEVLSKANELIDVEVKEKAVSLAEKVGIDLLEKAEEEILKAEGIPKLGNVPAYDGFTTNAQTLAIMDRLKGSTKNHVYNAYIELNKEDGKELEGKAGANVTGMF